MASMFPAITRAFDGAVDESSAKAILRALEVRFSIWELAADSLRNRRLGRLKAREL